MKAVLSCTDKEAALQGVHVPRFACRHLPNLEPLACSYANEGHAEIHPVKPARCTSLVAPAGHRKQMSLAVLKEGEMSCKVSSSLPDTPWQCEQKPAGYRGWLEGLRGSTGRTGMFLSPFWFCFSYGAQLRLIPGFRFLSVPRFLPLFLLRSSLLSVGP